MKLNRKQFNDLFEALNQTFWTNDELEKLAALACGKTLDEITTGGDTSTKIIKMIQKAQAEDWLGDLVNTALELRKTDLKLQQIHQEFQPIVVKDIQVNAHMMLDRTQFKKWLDALEQAFSTDDALKELVLFACNKRLDAITTAGNTHIKTMEIIKAAEAENWLGDLINAALELRKADPRIQEIHQEFQSIIAKDIDCNKPADKEM